VAEALEFSGGLLRDGAFAAGAHLLAHDLPVALEHVGFLPIVKAPGVFLGLPDECAHLSRSELADSRLGVHPQVVENLVLHDVAQAREDRLVHQEVRDLAVGFFQERGPRALRIPLI
jgi:hypothetical protein